MLSRFKSINFINTVLLLIALIQYYLLTPLNTGKETYMSYVMNFENEIKLIPGFLIFYYSVYILLIFVFISVIRKKESSDLTFFLVAIVLLWSIVNFAHGFFPTQNVIRPQISETSFFFQLINSLYTSVKPYALLPSWQAATAVLCTIVFVKMKFKRSALVIAWCVFICASPVFIKMNYIIDILVAVPLAYLSYFLAGKISSISVKTEAVQEIVKAFSLESLIQSVAIGIRDENTLGSLVDGLSRIEKNLSATDKEEIKKIGITLNPPVESLKEVINNLVLSTKVEKQLEKAKELFGDGEKSYIPNDKELKQGTEELMNFACRPFDNPKFRFTILEIKKNNTHIINNNSLEEAAVERSLDVIFRFRSFIESHKKDIEILDLISKNTNGHLNISFDEIKLFNRELRKPPYEISTDEVWNAFYRTDSANVKPLGDLKNPANIISLTQFALGKILFLEPYVDKVDAKFKSWIDKNKAEGKKYTIEEMDWLNMMKNYYATFLEINMTSFNQPPFLNKGGASKAYNLFGHDLNKILYELNEELG